MPKWVAWTLAVASVMTIVLAGVGIEQLGAYGDWTHEYTTPWSGAGFATVTAIVLAACWLPRSQHSRVLRVAVLFPLVLTACMVIGGVMWQVATTRLPNTHDISPYLRMLPPSLVLAGAAATTVVGGAIIGVRRRGMWLHATTTLALMQLMLVGMWLPFVINVFYGDTGGSSIANDVGAFHANAKLAALVLVPPLVVALGFTAIALRRYRWIHESRVGISYALAIALLLAVGTRAHLTFYAAIVYGNFVHVLFALTVVAVGSLCALSLSLWLRARRGRQMLARDALAGRISDDGGGPVATMAIAGWLRGPDVAARAFEVETQTGRIAVPGGIEIVFDPPAASMALASGQSLHVLQPGDRVTLAGFAKAREDAPYRGAAGMIPASTGAWVGLNHVGPAGFPGVALAMWRPCVAFLLVAVTVMLPALAGMLSG